MFLLLPAEDFHSTVVRFIIRVRLLHFTIAYTVFISKPVGKFYPCWKIVFQKYKIWGWKCPIWRASMGKNWFFVHRYLLCVGNLQLYVRKFPILDSSLLQDHPSSHMCHPHHSCRPSPVILLFQTQNFPVSQILPSIDILHLFGLISRIPGLLCGFFSVSVFFLVFSYRYFLPF